MVVVCAVVVIVDVAWAVDVALVLPEDETQELYFSSTKLAAAGPYSGMYPVCTLNSSPSAQYGSPLSHQDFMRLAKGSQAAGSLRTTTPLWVEVPMFQDSPAMKVGSPNWTEAMTMSATLPESALVAVQPGSE